MSAQLIVSYLLLGATPAAIIGAVTDSGYKSRRFQKYASSAMLVVGAAALVNAPENKAQRPVTEQAASALGLSK